MDEARALMDGRPPGGGVSSPPVEVSIVVPCLNEEALLEESIRTIQGVMDATGRTYELIFVDDGSRDGTPGILRGLALRDAAITCLFHPRTLGHGRSVTEGIAAARGGLVGFLDIDLEVKAEHIPCMLEALDAGHDVAVAHRMYLLRPGSWLRCLMTRVNRWLVVHWLGLPLKDVGAGFKFFRRERILPVLGETLDGRWFWHTELMALASLRGLKIAQIPCPFLRRSDKTSSVRLLPDTVEYLRCLYRFKRRLSAL